MVGRCVIASALVATLFMIAHVHSFSIPVPPHTATRKSSTIAYRNVRLQHSWHNVNNQDQDSAAAAAAANTRRRRRRLLASILATTTASLLLSPSSTFAAPPIAIIAEELGYFPVTNRKGQTVYVGKRVKRESSDQAIALAKHLHDVRTTMDCRFSVCVCVCVS